MTVHAFALNLTCAGVCKIPSEKIVLPTKIFSMLPVDTEIQIFPYGIVHGGLVSAS